MSDNVPFDVQREIIKLLPVKPLLRFRQVSKPWKSLIDSSDFIANYHFSNAPLQHHILVRYYDSKHEQYVSIVDDDDSFPRHKFPLIIPSDARQLGEFPDIIGGSQGLLCLCYKRHSCETNTFVLWNPTIRKSVPIVVPNVFNNTEFETAVGFGVCPRTSDPKLVKINYISSLQFNPEKCIPSQVEIFNLNSGSWKTFSSMSVPRKSIELTWYQVCVDKFIYWVAADRTLAGQTIRKKKLILSFDMITEEFTEIDLPNNLAYLDDHCLHLSKLFTSLIVLESERGARKNGRCCVWRMEYGVQNSFTKLYDIKSPSDSLAIMQVHDFRKTGEPIIEMLFTERRGSAVFAYEPGSGEITDTGIDGGGFLCLAKSYIETLLLLDQ
ncbi:putative F-box protein At3g16210 [Rutidosis leptorrhynchoides]|uniref:putative F-box protein At3g16210 n=1 Tax=Rutidosis leptorrhynchoides TaxID=125765 RepID=UPI003A9A1620